MEKIARMSAGQGNILPANGNGRTDRSTDAGGISSMARACTRCRLCQRDCGFLQQYGLPGDIAAEYRADRQRIQSLSFSCSLCGLCTAICPVGLAPAQMFLDLRREAYAEGRGDYPEHRRIMAYGRRGSSRRYSWYSLPDNCETIFFPGCTLPGSRSEQTEKLYDYLQGIDTTIGIVLDCCAKPAHDLGRQQAFARVFFELRDYLLAAGVKTVIVACPNCHKIFSEYGGGLAIVTIYELIARHGMGTGSSRNVTVTLHDPCAARFIPDLHAAIRVIIQRQGLSIQEMAHTGERTFCCGEGGAVGARDRRLAERWTSSRAAEAGGRLIITYCAGCTGLLQRMAPTGHLVDLLFEPQLTLTGKARGSRAPFTYFNRIGLKRRLKKKYTGTITRERAEIKMQARKSRFAVSSIYVSLIGFWALAAVFMIWLGA